MFWVIWLWWALSNRQAWLPAHHFRIKLNRNGRFEFESNLKAIVCFHEAVWCYLQCDNEGICIIQSNVSLLDKRRDFNGNHTTQSERHASNSTLKRKDLWCAGPTSSINSNLGCCQWRLLQISFSTDTGCLPADIDTCTHPAWSYSHSHVIFIGQLSNALLVNYCCCCRYYFFGPGWRVPKS